MEICVVLSVKTWDFQDEGRQVKGASLTYFTMDVEDEPQRRGVVPMTVPLAEDALGSLSALPGLYDVSFKQRPGRGGKPTLTVTGAKLRRPLVDVFKAPQQVA